MTFPQAASGGRARPGLRPWWPMLIAPAAMAVLAGLGALGLSRPELKRFLDGPAQSGSEWIAPWLVAAAATIFLLRAAVTRSPLSLILTALSVALLLREIHFEWTHRGVFVMLAAVGLWAAAWRRRLRRPLRDVRQAAWLAGMLGAYFLAFLISRRAFRFVPGEGDLHNFLEEGMETVCHVMLIVTSLAGRWRRFAPPR